MEGVLGRTLAEFYSIAYSSTTTGRIPILFKGDCWARLELNNGIEYVRII